MSRSHDQGEVSHDSDSEASGSETSEFEFSLSSDWTDSSHDEDEVDGQEEPDAGIRFKKSVR